MLKLYGFGRVNKGARGKTRDLRVLWALEEIGLPYEIARVAKAPPRGGEIPVGATAVRCTYCHGLWFPSPLQVTCSHCGARA